MRNWFSGKNRFESEVQRALWDELRLYPIELDPAYQGLLEVAPARPRRRTVPLATAAAVFAALFLAVLGWLPGTGHEPVAEIYETTLGERVTLSLADGSMVYLNSGSRAQVLVTDTGREIVLDWGEAMFRVAHDPSRPFVVRSANGTAKALGTVFHVSLLSNELAVTVVEGRVEVSAPTTSSPRLTEVAHAHQQIIIDRRGRKSSRTVTDLQPLLAWVDGKLVFRGETLDAAVDKLNRHNPAQLEVTDPELASLPIYGIFNIGDRSSFLAALDSAYGLGFVTKEDGSVRIVRAKQNGNS